MRDKPTLITCPECGEQIDVSDAIEHSVQEGRKAHDEQIVREAIQQGRTQALTEAQAALQAKDALLKTAGERELQALQEVEQLRLKQVNVDLEVQRKLLELTPEREQAAMARAEQMYELKIAERDKKLADALRETNDLKRKLDQGSMQLQGDVLEVSFEKQLCEVFGNRDKITAIATGKNGSDIAQHVRTIQGRSCGVILHETKRTKDWQEKWIEKIRTDMERAGARVGVIITETMPPDITSGYGHRGGDVWVCDLKSAILLVKVLRHMLEAVEMARGHREGVKTNAEALYNYVTGNEFAQRICRIMEVFIRLRAQAESERRAMLKHYANRIKQLDIGLESLGGVSGEIEAISNKDVFPEVNTVEFGDDDLSEAVAA
jgi:hypothetical protein